MIFYQLIDHHEGLDEYFTSFAAARRQARSCANLWDILRVETKPLSKKLLLAALNQEGFAISIEEVAHGDNYKKEEWDA